MEEISGPNIVGYFNNEGRKIIMMGDLHGNRMGECGGKTLSIKDYLIKFIKKVSKGTEEYDLFIEWDVPRKAELIKEKLEPIFGDDFLIDVINYMRANYKKIKNVRMHFTDIRSDPDIPELYCNMNTYYYYFFESLKLLHHSEKFKTDINLNDIYDLMCKSQESFVWATFSFMKDILEDKKDIRKSNYHPFLSQRLMKEIIKFGKHDTHNMKIMLGYVLEILQNYLSGANWLYKNKLIIEKGEDPDKKTNMLYALYNDGIDAGCAIADTYVISRIMKSNKYKNCILYVGKTHYGILKNLLPKLGFNQTLEVSASKEKFRCTKIFDFHDFFTNKTK
jgi:hypothetical protein